MISPAIQRLLDLAVKALTEKSFSDIVFPAMTFGFRPIFRNLTVKLLKMVV